MEQPYQAGHMLAPTRSRRDDSQWADELTHPNPDRFCPTFKADVSPIFPFFKFLAYWNLEMKLFGQTLLPTDGSDWCSP